MTTTIWPIVYASLAYFMFRAGAEPETLLLASLGATVMGIWSVTTVDAADSIQRQRWLGVLELLVAAPTPFWAVLLPITIASSAIGIYSLVSTLLWGRLVFGIPLHLEQPLLFALAIPPTIVSIGLLGFVMASRDRPLPRRLGGREHVRVPGLARHRPADPGRAAAGLGRADLVGAGADLGHAGAQRLRLRERLAASSTSRCASLLSVVYTVLGATAARSFPRVGAPPRDPVADMSALRVALIGGLLSFRGLFNWLHPALFIPTLIVPPLFQVLFFAYLGRAAELESDTFYVVGNSIQLAALPGIFAMSQAIAGERRAQTLPHLLVRPRAGSRSSWAAACLRWRSASPSRSRASRSARSCSMFEMSWSSLPLLVLAMAAAAFSCTALGVAHAAIALRVRELAVFSNIVFAVLLVFCGVNVPLDDLPNWMSTVAQGLPVTHAVEAGREAAAGATLADVAGLLATELAIGAAFLVLGLALLRYYEYVARRQATLELT